MLFSRQTPFVVVKSSVSQRVGETFYNLFFFPHPVQEDQSDVFFSLRVNVEQLSL